MASSESRKILVVYYSRSGATRAVANAIARYCRADVEELRDVESRRGFGGYVRSAVEALRAQQGRIREPVRNPRDYDVVVLGTPVWAGHMSSPLRAYLAQCSVSGKQAAFFCTMGGRGAENVFAELTRLTGQAPLATLAMTTREAAQRPEDVRISKFAATLLDNKEIASAADIAHGHLASAH